MSTSYGTVTVPRRTHLRHRPEKEHWLRFPAAPAPGQPAAAVLHHPRFAAENTSEAADVPTLVTEGVGAAGSCTSPVFTPRASLRRSSKSASRRPLDASTRYPDCAAVTSTSKVNTSGQASASRPAPTTSQVPPCNPKPILQFAHLLGGCSDERGIAKSTSSSTKTFFCILVDARGSMRVRRASHVPRLGIPQAREST